MAIAADLRRLALSLDGTTEHQHMDRRAFKVQRIYATLAPDELTVNLKFTPDEQEFKCQLAPKLFQPLPNAWGRQGWTQMILAEADTGDVLAALKIAHSHALKTSKNKS